MAQSRRNHKVTGTTYNYNLYDTAGGYAKELTSPNLRSHRHDDFTEEEEEFYESMKEKKARIRAARARKARIRRRKRTAIAAAIMAVIFMAILFLTGNHTFASATDSSENYLYYTTVTVEPGDTVWTLADSYADSTDLTKKQYVNEVCKMNGVLNDSIRPGDTLTMFYYSDEAK